MARKSTTSQKPKSRKTLGVPKSAALPLPPTQLEALAKHLRNSQCERILKRLLDGTDKEFEATILRLFIKMEKYGKYGRVTGRSADRGIDVELYSDPAGLNLELCVQAKLWAKPVGGPVVREFIGAVEQRKAKQGVLVTTSKFTTEAWLAYRSDSTRVTLIPGDEFSQLMYHHDYGVRLRHVIEIKALDLDQLG